MRIDRYEEFITPSEQEEIRQWFNSSPAFKAGLSRGECGYTKRKTTRQSDKFEYPKVIDEIYNRIISKFSFTKGCHKELLPCGYGFIAVKTLPDGDTYLHKDPANCKNGMSVIRFNILIQQPDRGGELILIDNHGNEVVVDVTERELYACNLSDYSHRVTTTLGSKPRYILLFSICCPADAWEDGTIKYKE